jgi:hypothetical protein
MRGFKCAALATDFDGEFRPVAAQVRIHIDLGQTESIDPRRAAAELLAQGADRGDELVTYYAGEPTAFPAGRLADLAGGPGS